MKSILLLFASLVLDCGTSVVAFAPPVVPTPPPLTQTKLDATRRRDVLASLLLLGSGATTLFVPDEAKAFSQQLDDYAYEPHQQATDGKFDLNSAFVVSPRRRWHDYRKLMLYFPTLMLTFLFVVPSSVPHTYRVITSNFGVCSLPPRGRLLVMVHTLPSMKFMISLD